MDTERKLTDIESDLRATAEDLVADTGRLQAIERRKKGLPANDPRLVQLALKAEEIADEIAAKASIEAVLAKDAARAS